MSLTPFVQSLSGHSGQVSAMAGEAGWLVTGGRDAVARLWASSEQQWRHVRDMAGHKSPVGAGAAMCVNVYPCIKTDALSDHVCQPQIPRGHHWIQRLREIGQNMERGGNKRYTIYMCGWRIV